MRAAWGGWPPAIPIDRGEDLPHQDKRRNETPMKKLSLLAPVALAATLAAGCGMTRDYEWVDFGGDPMVSMNPDFMASMMAASTPGEAHAEMAKGAGTWKVDSTWWSWPGSEGQSMVATADVSMMWDRHMVMEFKSDWMGMPYNGHMIMGFDNYTEEYWSIWIDSMGTQISISRGQVDESGVVHMNGTWSSPNTPAGRPFRTETHHLSDDEFRMDFYDSHPEGEFMSMTMTYTRA